jgi:hypothetical protein
MKLDLFAAPIALEAHRRFVLSGMADAPVVAERERPARRKPRRRATPTRRRLVVRFQAA